MATTVFYKDLSLDFIPHPVTGDIRPITDEVAIKRSIANLIKTERGTKPFRPDYGSEVKKFAFQQGIFAEDALNKSLYDTLSRFEPRIIVTKIESTIDKNDVTISVDYIIRNLNTTSTIETKIKKVA
ncbi:hypothetical protein EBS02_00335 [bacterium]|nr:hypothetical protein [bacterium]